MTEESVAAAVAAELRLLDPAVRGSRALVAALLDPEFTEVGSSGRRHTYADTVASLPDHPGGPGDDAVYEPSGLTGVLLAPGLVQLSYETLLAGQRARRTSLWRWDDGTGSWRMYHHQGTPVPPGIP
ncbi:nuclear transport factor 2 family protein [Streptomyces sp. NPDC052077]|uniref:nuclear transport factor 2 family protein n=1 Tax=Streptomyces sp. NPDC052077 TaxID=3154757 RepID=UPI003439333F